MEGAKYFTIIYHRMNVQNRAKPRTGAAYEGLNQCAYQPSPVLTGFPCPYTYQLYIDSMKKLFGQLPLSLWVLILLTALLFSLQLWGSWSPNPGTAFSRLIENPRLAGIEVGFSALLIFCAWLSRSKPNWIVIIVALAAIGCALYHLFNYLIGIEFLLLYGASNLIRKNFRTVDGNGNV